MNDRPRTIRAVFGDATTGYAGVERLRAAGFQIELAGSAEGDLVVSVQAAPERLDELLSLVDAHDGRIETKEETAGR